MLSVLHICIIISYQSASTLSADLSCLFVSLIAMIYYFLFFWFNPFAEWCRYDGKYAYIVYHLVGICFFFLRGKEESTRFMYKMYVHFNISSLRNFPITMLGDPYYFHFFFFNITLQSKPILPMPITCFLLIIACICLGVARFEY